MYPIFPHIYQTEFYFPVIVYSMVITTMGYLSFHRYWNARHDTAAPRIKQGAEASKATKGLKVRRPRVRRKTKTIGHEHTSEAMCRMEMKVCPI